MPLQISIIPGAGLPLADCAGGGPASFLFWRLLGEVAGDGRLDELDEPALQAVVDAVRSAYPDWQLGGEGSLLERIDAYWVSAQEARIAIRTQRLTPELLDREASR